MTKQEAVERARAAFFSGVSGGEAIDAIAAAILRAWDEAVEESGQKCDFVKNIFSNGASIMAAASCAENVRMLKVSA